MHHPGEDRIALRCGERHHGGLGRTEVGHFMHARQVRVVDTQRLERQTLAGFILHPTTPAAVRELVGGDAVQPRQRGTLIGPVALGGQQCRRKRLGSTMPITLKNTGPVLPYIRYSPQANTMTIASEDNKPREIPYLGKSFAIDIENGMPGWLLIGEGLRDWKPFPLGSSPPAPGPGFKRGFAILHLCAKASRQP